ncbi:MAG: HNH endonuclease [Bacteroidota bacterium]
MRPVDKGAAPRFYNDYGQARHDLAERIGYYCSYCEMKVYNSIEVEHILPQNQGGAVFDWDNFLLSCKYCNTIKGDHNANIMDFLWPDRDNTDLAFEYDEIKVIYPEDTLPDTLKAKAQNSINLTGLDRNPAGPNLPTPSDTRWKSRKEAWDFARLSLKNWNKARIQPMANTIANLALSSGHYSIWMKVFKAEQIMLDAIDQVYRTKHSLYKIYRSNGQRDVRAGGFI